MPEIDTSFYKQQPQNPLDNIAKTVGIANSVEQNKLLQGQQVQQNIGIDKSKLELAVSQLGQLRNMFAPHLNNQNVSTKDITQIGIDAIKQGLATPQQVATELARFPKDGTPQQRQGWVRDMYVRSLSHENQISQMLGTPQGVGTGGGTTIYAGQVATSSITLLPGYSVMVQSDGTYWEVLPVYVPTQLKNFEADGTYAVPGGFQIEGIIIENTTANAVTGGIRIGTTAGGTQVVVAQPVGANALLKIMDADILLKVFSVSAPTSLFVEAVTNWNTASVNFYFIIKPFYKQ